MTIKLKFLASMCLLLALGGCASGPAYNEYAGSIDPMLPLDGRIFVYRTSALGAAVQPKVWLNDEVVGKAKPKGFFYLDRPAGTYKIAASTEVERSLTFTLNEGETKYVRLEVKMGAFVGHVKPVLVDAGVARQELQKMKFTGEETVASR